VRSLRYNNAHIHLNCGLHECRLSILPKGWNRQHKIDFPRRQLINTMAIKTDSNGKYIDANPSLTDDLRFHTINNNKNGRSAAYRSSTYRGPDDHGHYTSYAIVLAMHDPNHYSDPNASASLPPAQQMADLQPLLEDHYVERLDDNSTSVRLILRQFQMGQSKRRVRTMIAKIDGYIQRRRTQLIAKENAPPGWQGVLMIVVGIMGFLLTCLLGQFWEETDSYHGRGGARGHTPRKSSSSSSATARTMPVDYEVNTKATVVRPRRQQVTSSSSSTNQSKESWIMRK
jgi:hypothetical protein